MLQVIRDKVTGWIAGVIIGLLTIPFALWGVNNYFTAQVDNYIAKVNDDEISPGEFQNRFRQYQERMNSMFGGSLGAEYFDQPLIKRQFLQSLIQEKLLTQLVQSENLQISASELSTTIAGFESFQVDGKFNPEVYRSLLRQRMMSAQEFEQDIARQILLSKIPQSLSQSAFLTDAELAQSIALEQQKRSFDYAILDASALTDDIQFEENEIQAYYTQHQEDFMIPEKVVVEYLELKASDYLSEVEIDEALILERFESQKTRFVIPERRKVSHILVEVAADASEETKSAAQDKIKMLQDKLAEGESFADLARSYSEDPGSKDIGGDLGWVETGVMVAEFEAGMNLLTQAGDISEPVESPFGIHLIRLDEYEPEQGKSFEDAKPELVLDYQEEQAEKSYLDLADQLVEQAFEDPNSLEPAAEAIGLSLRKSEAFAETGGTGLFANPEVIKTAFSSVVKNESQNSDPIDLADNHMMVLRVDEVLPSEPQALDEVRDMIVNQLKFNRAKEKLAEAVTSVETALSTGENLQAALDANGYTLETLEDMARTTPGQVPGLQEKIFQVSAQEFDPACEELSEGRILCYQLTKVVDGEAAQLAMEEKQQIENRLNQAYSNAELTALIKDLETKADIIIEEDRL